MRRRTTSAALPVAAALIAVAVAMSMAMAPAPPSAPVRSIGTASAPRGAMGEIVFDYSGPPLCARADQAENAPVLVRLVRLEEPSTVQGASRYRLTFLGAISGDYDLLPLIEHCDGRPVADLAPILVQVFTQLPENHGTDLYTEDRPLPLLSGHYRLLVGLILAAWLLVPVVVLLRRWLRRRPPEAPVPTTPPLTLADQLRPLVEAARSRGLSVAEQGRLELLLLRFWRDRLGMGSLGAGEAVARLRREPEAGALLLAVEGWLHQRGAASPQPGEDVAGKLSALLAPYREVPAFDDAALAAGGTP